MSKLLQERIKKASIHISPTKHAALLLNAQELNNGASKNDANTLIGYSEGLVISPHSTEYLASTEVTGYPSPTDDVIDNCCLKFEECCAFVPSILCCPCLGVLSFCLNYFCNVEL